MGSAQESISIRCMVFVLLASQYIFIGEERHESRGEKKLKGDGRTDGPAGERTARWRDDGACRSRETEAQDFQLDGEKEDGVVTRTRWEDEEGGKREAAAWQKGER